MNIRPALVTNSKPSELMQPGDTALNDPTRFAQAAAVLSVPASELAFDATFGQSIAMEAELAALFGLLFWLVAAGVVFLIRLL